jgi:nucleotide-binding universal stress UspA family protein
LDTENLNESLNKFVAEHNSDLLCMIRRKRGALENIFHESATTKKAFNTPVPLLILQEGEK